MVVEMDRGVSKIRPRVSPSSLPKVGGVLNLVKPRRTEELAGFEIRSFGIKARRWLDTKTWACGV